MTPYQHTYIILLYQNLYVASIENVDYDVVSHTFFLPRSGSSGGGDRLHIENFQK